MADLLKRNREFRNDLWKGYDYGSSSFVEKHQKNIEWHEIYTSLESSKMQKTILADVSAIYGRC